MQSGGVNAKGRRDWSMEHLLGALGNGHYLLFGSNFFPIS